MASLMTHDNGVHKDSHESNAHWVLFRNLDHHHILTRCEPTVYCCTLWPWFDDYSADMGTRSSDCISVR